MLAPAVPPWQYLQIALTQIATETEPVMRKLLLTFSILGALQCTALQAADFLLTPQNCRIQFVGTHSGEKPDPRTGHFQKLSGVAVIAEGQLSAISVDIDTRSLTTDIDKLTNHLKSPDFFNVNEHPKARFVSRSIESTPEGKTLIKGELTLLGKTKAVSFPATVSTREGLTLTAEFPIDRTEFGMDYAVDKVEKTVQMKVTVGQ